MCAKNFIKNIAIFSALITSLSVAAQDRQQYGDWMVECKKEENQCTISQVAVLEGSEETLMQLAMIFTRTENDENSQLLAVLPLGVPLDTSPVLILDDEVVAELPIRFCLTDGCYFSMDLGTDLLEKFIAAEDGVLKLNSPRSGELNIPVSGDGSKAAFNSLWDRF